MNDAYFHLLMCHSVVTALHSHKCEQSSQPLLLLTKHWCVWTLARSQHVYSESGPAVHFLLWIGSYPLFNTRAEWVHKCRQETIHCAHVFSENTDKLEAVTFTHGHVSEVKQASRAAAAGCVTACVYKTVWNWPCDPLCLRWTITCSGLDWDWGPSCSQAVVPPQQLGQHRSVTGTICAASCFSQNTQAPVWTVDFLLPQKRWRGQTLVLAFPKIQCKFQNWDTPF